ncbi:ribonuclease HII [Nisaea acidiphila]|uniref:Ribonuclease HII n=1 Tax=Nisaea acidiphila TaxID=1862145 RepID=A0A9J7AJY3_9PROT|nr:ribonuclease HII [Nisaea acidiphila]UUX47979.1 ribonuclease HII [Nisaea acidiphila]
MPDLTLEFAAGAAAGRKIAGIDEVGRGPLAGPVVAVAACIPPALFSDSLIAEVNDSKKLSPAKRELIAAQLREAIPHGIGLVEVAEIDRINILQATFAAMERAVEILADRLGAMPDHCLVDGNRLPKLPVPAEPVIKGDQRSASIAAASIIAKVHRDGIMAALAERHPGYGWERNAGYGTAEHLAALAKLGVTPHHRRSFRPVREAVSIVPVP